MLPRQARITKLKFCREEVGTLFQDLVETTIRTRDAKGIVWPDMLQSMMENRGLRFLLGRFASTLMCFAAHEIAINEDVQRKLQDEIDQVLEDTKGQAPYDVINNMEYLDVVLNEALRMYPVAVMTHRECREDFELTPTLPGAKPYTVKKGQFVIIPIYKLHCNTKYFEQPEKFDPERFLGDQKKQIFNSGAYLPFGLGPRMCIGNRFALMETKVLLFHLLARCDLLPCEKTSMLFKLSKEAFVMKPEDNF